MHWACSKITSSLAIPDANLLDILLDKVCVSCHFLRLVWRLWFIIIVPNGMSQMMFFEFQLKLCKGISFAAVAAHADKSGRRKLAAMLVEHEPRSTKQVIFFLHHRRPALIHFFFLFLLFGEFYVRKAPFLVLVSPWSMISQLLLTNSFSCHHFSQVLYIWLSWFLFRFLSCYA